MFTKAEKRQGKLRIALTGPSGSGKTFSSLLIAKGIIDEMNKRGIANKGIAVIDTENGSAADYADRFEFDFLKIDPPYTIQKYIAALQAAYAGNYGVVDIDSITHAWAGEGGLLQKKEQLDSRGGNSYTNWGSITKEHEQFKGMILNNKIHLIATMRSKQDYILEVNDKGKQAPRKVGMAPIQRDGMEYEFTTVFDMGMDHSASASKDRTGIFDKQLFIPTAQTGQDLIVWRLSGKEEATEEKPSEPPLEDQTQVPPAAPPPTPPDDETIVVEIEKYTEQEWKGNMWGQAVGQNGIVYQTKDVAFRALLNSMSGKKQPLTIKHKPTSGKARLIVDLRAA